MPSVTNSVCVLLMLSLLDQVHTMNYENVTLLKTNLLSGYDSDVRPVNNQAEVVNVTAGMTLYQVLEVDTVRGVMTTTLALDVTWVDERMTWTPADYGGITSVMIQTKFVWTPPLTLGQPVEFKAIGETWMHVIYQSNGFAAWRPGGVNELTCQMDMKYWPFDEQKCDISFFPYDYWQGEVRMSVSQLVTSAFTENGEWSLEETDATTRNIYGVPEALFRVTLKRRPGFYILTLIFPLFGLGILTGFVFLLPSESGERVSYAITILLALTVFLTVISDNIPKLSNPVPLLCVFLLLGIIMSSITTLVVILNLIIFHRNPEKPVGPWYISIVRWTRCRSSKISDNEMIRDKLKEMEERANVRPDKRMTITSLNSKETGIDFKKKSPKLVMDYTGNDYDDDVITWKDVSYAIDLIMFFVMTALQTLPVLVLLIILVSQ